VNPVWVARCVRRLARSQTVVASVAGFPLGASLPATKADEARRAVEQGATEVDMVVNLGALVAGDKDAVVRDIEAVVAAVVGVHKDAVVKVILETRALMDEQIILGCRCAARAQADFIKTSTGFHPAGGATVEHVALLREHAGSLKVKAAGGIRDLETALAMIEAGADRLGMSASVRVVEELGN
jgi:deoxyribose-phosphate aldolase